MMLHSQKHPDGASLSKLDAREATVLIIALLCILNLIIYFPSIGGYFLADDFTHISYLYDVFHGKPALLLANFYSNWMQTAGTEFYRPLITLSLALDYLVWKNNALGFHLSNLFFQMVSTVLFYFLIQRLAFTLGGRQAKLLALVSATFFAVYPLHPEVVSWIIGRVDSMATMFYLAAFFVFLKYEQERSKPSSLRDRCLLGLSLVCYFCALLSKEIAITLPMALWLWLVMFSADENKLLPKILRALKATLPYWTMLGVYLAIRSMALGTVWGGYSGSLAVNFATFRSLFQQSLLTKLVFPFNEELFSPRHFLKQALRVLYALAAIALILRLWNRRFYWVSSKLIMYGLLWFVICLLPTYQVLYVNPNLQGSRILYLASLPICFLFSLLFVPISNNNLPSNRFTKFLTPISVSFYLLVLLAFARIAYLNNLPWRCAGDEVKELQEALVRKAASIGLQKKLVLVNVPYHYKGAHMLYNGYMLNLLCSTAVSGQHCCPILTFEHPLFGDPDLFNMTRLQRLLTRKDNYIFVAWQRPLSSDRSLANSNSRGSLREISIRNSMPGESASRLDFADSKMTCIDASKSEFIDLDLKPILTADSGLLEVSVKASNTSEQNTKKGYGLQLQWFSADNDAISKEGSLTLPLVIDNNTHSYLFNLREHKSWLLCNRVDRLKIFATPGKYRIEIKKARFLNPSSVIPQFDLYSTTARWEDAAGVYHLSPKQVITFQYDVSQIPGAQAVVYEISKSNVWFEHEEQTLNSNHFSHNIILTKKIANLRGDFEVHGSDLGLDYFETHLAAVDRQGHIVGLMSDPVYGQIGF